MGRFGGLESFVLTVAMGVADIPGISVEVLFKKAGNFLLHDDLKQKIRASSVKVTFCSRSSRLLWYTLTRADLVHLQNPCPDVVLMTRLLGKPLLLNIINHTKDDGSLHQRIWRFCLYLAHRRFYISNFVRLSWEKSSRPRHGSQVVFPICELSHLAPLPTEQRSGFVFVARWIENKGLDILVEAYASAGLDTKLWPLRLLGDGPLRPQIMDRLDELGLKGEVDTPGFLPEYEKADRIRHSRFAVIPPNTGEDFGLVAIEARHLGIPCLITTDGGVPEAAGPHSLHCIPGNEAALRSLLQQAASMSDTDYSRIAASAHSSLGAELVRPEFYADTYLAMLQRRR